MFTIEDTTPDNFADEIGKLLKKTITIKTMTKEKRALLIKAEKLMVENKYISFDEQTQNYFLSRVGTSYLYNVPKNKLGRLKVFRGKCIRIICVGSVGGFGFGRKYMAGVSL